jgi:hypothetical protein
MLLMNPTQFRTACAVRSYTASCHDPLQVKAGDVLTIEPKISEWSGWIWCVSDDGKGGWVPESWGRIEGTSFHMQKDYDATELNVSLDDTITVRDEESGWLLCQDRFGHRGWIPKEIVTEG